MSDEAKPPETNDFDSDDDDDDIANLFSFGIDEAEEVDDIPHATENVEPNRDRVESDPFLDMHLQHITTSSVKKTNIEYDQETKEMLNWLDEEPVMVEKEESNEEEKPNSIITDEGQLHADTEPGHQETESPVFQTLNDALQSNEATVEQIRSLCTVEMEYDTSLRSELYSRLICGKSLEVIRDGSLADSFRAWKPSKVLPWLNDQVKPLSAIVSEANGTSEEEAGTDIERILQHYYEQQADLEADELVPNLVATIVSTKVPVDCASVILSQLIPKFAPILALKPSERWDSAVILHRAFYLLACYHLPLLVFHLDRYLPGWYFPKRPDSADPSTQSATSRSRNQANQGRIPPSWLLSLAAGEECQLSMPMNLLLRLWDMILADDHSVRFFLGLAVLEKEADNLLLLTGDELARQVSETFSLESKDEDWFEEWCRRSNQLQRYTPSSIVEQLQKAEDDAVQAAVRKRQKNLEVEMKARLEEEAKAHKEAQEKRAEEARERLSRARLIAFYRKHAPEKEENIDKIMENYKGKLDVLDNKLLLKYGERFNPALKPAAKTAPSNFLSRSRSTEMRKEDNESQENMEHSGDDSSNHVALSVSPKEVLPSILAPRDLSVKKRLQRSLKFYLIDSRPEEITVEQGHFPAAINLGPETMLDPERMKKSEELLESFRGAVHFVIIGEGWKAIPEVYNQTLTPKLLDLARQDDSRVNICALFLLKRGFPFVSILEGGFASAYSWLVREGPSNKITLEEALIDYDEANSVFSQMETLRNSTATERAQKAMQNALDRSVVALTKRAMELEQMASDMESGDSKGGIRLDFFKNRFRNSGKGQQGASLPSKETKEEDNSSATNTESSEKPNEAPAPDASDVSADSEVMEDPQRQPHALDVVDEKIHATKEEAPQPKNPLASFRKMSEKMQKPQAPNPFKGIGAQFNRVASGRQAQSMENGQQQNPQNILKRNPFARFGEDRKGDKKPNRFGNFGNLGKAAMERVRSGNSQDAESGKTEAAEEESISFES